MCRLETGISTRYLGRQAIVWVLSRKCLRKFSQQLRSQPNSAFLRNVAATFAQNSSCVAWRDRLDCLWTIAPELPPACVIDLPGLYSLDATSLDEQIARDILLGRGPEIVRPDVIVVVVDATNLVRNLYLATQLIEIERPGHSTHDV